MAKGALLKLGFCLGVASLCLYSYLDQQNEVTHLKIRLPQLQQEVNLIAEENCRLQYEIDRAESPTRLIEWAHRPEFGHLKHPVLKEVLTVPEGVALKSDSDASSGIW